MAYTLFAVLFVSILGLGGCATRGFIREQLNPLRTDSTALLNRLVMVEERMGGLENRSAMFEKQVARGINIVGASIEALDKKTTELRGEVQLVEKETSARLQKLGKEVGAARREGKATQHHLQEVAEGLSDQLNFHAVDQLGPAVADEGESVRQAVTADGGETRQKVADEGVDTRQLVTEGSDATRSEITGARMDIRTTIYTDGDETRRVVQDEGKSIRARVASEGVFSRWEVENKARGILDELQKIAASPTTAPPTVPAASTTP